MSDGNSPHVDIAGSVWAGIAKDGRLKLIGGAMLLVQAATAALSFAKGSPEIAIFGAVAVLAFMLLLTVFIAISSGAPEYRRLGGFMLWSVVLAFVSSIALLLASYFGCWPAGLGGHCKQSVRFVRGTITDVPDRDKMDFNVAYDGVVFGGYDTNRSEFNFVVFEIPPHQSELGFWAATKRVKARGPAGTRPAEPANPAVSQAPASPQSAAAEKDEVEDLSIRVPVACIASFFASGKPISWSYRDEGTEADRGPGLSQPALYDGERLVGTILNRSRVQCQGGAAADRARFGWLRRFLPVSQAFAQSPTAPPAELPAEVREAIPNLGNDDLAVRRSAREALAGASVEAVPPLLEAMRTRPDDYRLQLGGSIALTEMLRRNKADAARIAPLLGKPEDRALLLNAAGAPDRTLRIYASEFLYDLGDPTVAREAVALAARTGDENGRYNLLLVAQGGWHKLSAAQKQDAAGDLAAARQNAGPMTQKLFEKLN